MEESDTYLMIVDEGQVKRLKKDILILGESRLGTPDESVKGRLEGISDLERLDRLFHRAFEAASWDEILNTP